MSVLYKYSNQLGAVKILGSLELKLPCISELNDPLECTPNYKCEGDDKKELREKHIRESENKKKELCLLSVSFTATESVMWAHYADIHKGIVIGIDFEEILYNIDFPTPLEVNYSNKRGEIDITPGKVNLEKLYFGWKKVLKTKSKSWGYEQEWRILFLESQLQQLQGKGITCLRKLNGRNSWFLCLKPSSIKKVVFGLFTEEGLKLTIRKLMDRPELKHVRFYQAEKSSKTFNLKLLIPV